MPKPKKEGKPRAPKPERVPEAGFIIDAYIDYYKKQFIPNLLNEEEFEQMIASFKTSLPHVFRISPVAENPELLRQQFEKYVDEIRSNGFDIKKIDFFGDDAGSIYQMSIDNPNFRRNPVLQPFRDWLHTHENCGDISRQELVSMIPPYFLDVKPEHNVIDMCAAPGSKTTQVIEMMLSQAGEEGAKGIVIANEVKAKRCRTLAGRLQRLDNRQTIVVAHPGQHLPPFTEFDRVICDVPCSGDGTLRKSPDAGPNWNIGEAQGLHTVQKAILINALKLLKVGGRVVYSTCSLNPIEDEAIIASVVRSCGDSVEIVDVSDKYPTLKRLPGLKTWTVYSREGPLENFETVPEGLRKHIPESMFPVDVPETITRCMRFLPHLNDTGGFFVTVLEKKGEITVPIPMNTSQSGKWIEPPFFPIEKMESDIDTFAALKEEYGLADSIKKENCFTRADNKVHSICLLNDTAAKITKETAVEKLRAIACGARVFSWKKLKDPSAVHATPCFEGINVAFEASSKRKFAVSPHDMKLLIAAGNPGVPFDQLEPDLAKQLSESLRGGLFMYIEGTKIRYGGMINKSSVSLHIKKNIINDELIKLKEHFPEIEIDDVVKPRGKAAPKDDEKDAAPEEDKNED